MGNIMESSLNKGVPVSASIDIRNADFVDVTGDKNKTKELLMKNFEKFMDYIATLGPRFDVEYFMSLSAVVDAETLERKIIFSPSAYFSTLIFSLNLNGILNKVDYSELLVVNDCDPIKKFKEPLEKRIKILKEIKNENELRIQFPFLLKKFQARMQQRKTCTNLLIQLNSMNRKEKREYIKKMNKMYSKEIPGFNLEEYINEGLNFNIGKFVYECSTVFTTLLENYDNIMKYIYSHPIDFSSLNNVDKNKIELYFAHRFLNMVEMVSEEEKQDYLYYVSNFFTEHRDLLDSDLSIEIGNMDEVKVNIGDKRRFRKVITPTSLYDEYRKLLVENPNLRAIDFSHFDFNGMSTHEVKEFMDEYLKDLSAQWDFLLPDDRSYEEEVVKKIKVAGKGMSEEERIHHQNVLLDLFIEKKSLYDSSDPFFRVKGKGTFDGYIGFIYPNGRVVLDKFYDDADNGKLADGQAIYAMGVSEFYELSKLSKTELIRNKLCKRYIHKGNWVERVKNNEINIAVTDDASLQVKKLIDNGLITDPDGAMQPSFMKK